MSISHWCSLRGPTAHHCQQHNRDVDDWTAHTRLRVKMAPVKSSQPLAIWSASFCSALETQNSHWGGGGQFSLQININIFLSNIMTVVLLESRPTRTISPVQNGKYFKPKILIQFYFTIFCILFFLLFLTIFYYIHTEPTHYLSANRNISLFRVEGRQTPNIPTYFRFS